MVMRTSSKGFTLIELLIVLGIVGIVAAVVLVAINPSKQLCDVQNAARMVHKREIEKALQQYLIGEWSRAGGNSLPTGEENAKAVCRTGITPDETCISLDALVPEYIVAVPVDETEVSETLTGYAIYLDRTNQEKIVALNMEVCEEESQEASSSSSSSTSSSASTPSSGASSSSFSIPYGYGP